MNALAVTIGIKERIVVVVLSLHSHSMHRARMHSLYQRFTFKVTRCHWLSRVGCAQFGLTQLTRRLNLSALSEHNAVTKRSLEGPDCSTFSNVLLLDQPLINLLCLRCGLGSGRNIQRSGCLGAHRSIPPMFSASEWRKSLPLPPSKFLHKSDRAL